MAGAGRRPVSSMRKRCRCSTEFEIRVENRYRPWGPLQWLIDKLSGRQWDLLGSLSTEDRCVAVLGALSPDRLRTSRFLKIIDPSPLPTERFELRYQEIAQCLIELGARPEAFRQVDLVQDIDSIREELNAFLGEAGPDIVLEHVPNSRNRKGIPESAES